MTSNAFICGVGSFVPERTVANADLEKIVNTSDEWIRTRTGICERHYLDEGMNSSDSGAAAASAALDAARTAPVEVTHVICATCTPDCLSPSNACLIAGKLGITPQACGRDVMCFDVNAACTGFVYCLDIVRSILAARPDAVVLLVAAEGLSRRTNFADRSTCVLFGDAGGAAVLKGTREGALWEVRDVRCGSDGSLAGLIHIGGGSASPMKVGTVVDESYFISMNGMAVFKHAVRCMTEISLSILGANGLSVDELGMFIPHQANLRIINAVGERLGIDSGRVFTNVEKYGNTSAVSLPLALDEALSAGVLTPAARVLLASFGAGMTWGAALLIPA